MTSAIFLKALSLGFHMLCVICFSSRQKGTVSLQSRLFDFKIYLFPFDESELMQGTETAFYSRPIFWSWSESQRPALVRSLGREIELT